MKYCFITGVSRGLGFELAKVMLENGYHVVGMGRRDNPELKTKHPSHYSFLNADFENVFASEEKIKAAFEAARAKNPETIILMNNAAVSNHSGIIPLLKNENIMDSLHTNLIAPIVLSKLFLAALKGSSAKIKLIHISSGSASKPTAGGNLYNIAKAGLEMLSQGIESERESIGLNFETVIFRPGTMDTDMQTEKRNMSKDVLPSVQMYKDFYEKGLLRKPELVAKVVFDELVQKETVPGKVYLATDYLK